MSLFDLFFGAFFSWFQASAGPIFDGRVASILDDGLGSSSRLGLLANDILSRRLCHVPMGKLCSCAYVIH